MTTTDALISLAMAWIHRDRSAGPALHDALEEAGWPLEWVWNCAVNAQLSISGKPLGICLAEIWRRGPLDHGWGFAIREQPGGMRETAESAQSAAESRLRQCLAGE